MDAHENIAAIGLAPSAPNIDFRLRWMRAESEVAPQVVPPLGEPALDQHRAQAAGEEEAVVQGVDVHLIGAAGAAIGQHQAGGVGDDAAGGGIVNDVGRGAVPIDGVGGGAAGGEAQAGVFRVAAGGEGDGGGEGDRIGNTEEAAGLGGEEGAGDGEQGGVRAPCAEISPARAAGSPVRSSDQGASARRVETQASRRGIAGSRR